MKTKLSFYAAILAVCTMFIIGAVIVGCGGDDETPTGPTDNTADINAYLKELPSWDEFANVADTVTAPIGDMIADMSNLVLCTTTPYSITQNPEEIVTFGSAPDVLYLGSLIQGDSYIGGLGSMEELPIRQRAPLTVAIKLLTGTDITRTVENPDAASVQSALSDMVAEAAEGGHQSGSRIWYDYKQSYSSTQAALSLGVSFKYMGSSGRAALDFTTSEETNTVTAFFKQIMFEAYIVRPQTPAQFFSADFTKERLDEQIDLGNIGPNNLPVYVARIQYGRMMIYSMTHTSSASMLKSAVYAGYNGLASVDVEIQAEVESILQNATIKVATIGGSADNALSLLRSGSLNDYFTSDDPLTTAEPLAYALCNLADGSLATVSETTEYDMRMCSGVNAECYLNETEWQMAVADLAGDNLITEFLTTADNLTLSYEVTVQPVPNTHMGNILTFDSSTTHFPLSFYLKALNAQTYGLTFMDLEGGAPAFGSIDQERSISIGEVDDEENDDFEIQIQEWHPNCAVFAIGITVGDNTRESGEFIALNGINSFYKKFDMSPACAGTHGFIGIVSTVPLTSVAFNEVSTGDDIFVRDICFGVLEWTDK
jgi:hypothetical protein